MLTRRRFVQTVGLGAAGAVTGSWISARGREGSLFAMELQGVTPTRPLPYDLMQTMLGELNASVDQVVIAELTDQVFYARILVSANGNTLEIDARPCDAIALAVRTGSRILVNEPVMDAAGVAIDEDDDSATLTAGSAFTGGAGQASSEPEQSEAAPSPSDEQLSVFRDFINSLDLDDFGKKQSN